MSYHDTDTTDTRKILSALCHGACFFSATIVSIGIPLGIFFLSSDPVVKSNAKEALNFQLSVFIWGIIGAILTVVLIGFVILGIVGLFSLIAPIIAIFSVLANPGQSYRYSFIFRLL
ncbi:MAG: DUF4870 domain-containing protein [Prochlorotrichaceae cyanobacterium]|jgi:uncharacterized Tic20 family protein